MSLFRIVKYSSILYFLGRHRTKLFRSVAVLLFALVTSFIYEDLRVYLELQHPGTLIYALVGKVIIVYGSLIFVLLQFRPGKADSGDGEERARKLGGRSKSPEENRPEPHGDRLDALADIEHHDRLRSRYDRILAGTETSPRKR